MKFYNINFDEDV